MRIGRLFVFFLTIMVGWANPAFSELVDTVDIVKLDLPVLKITTINSEEPTCNYVFAPKGAFGISITDAVKVPGRAVISIRDSILYDSGDYEKNVSGMTIKIRGNTSAYYYSKKPFKIKLQKKADMLSRGDRRYNDKDWILIRDGDETFNTMIGLKLSELMDLGWAPAYQYVNLMMNGEYRGIYMLLESIDRNADCRINVDKESGYLFERDAYWWNEDVYFATSMLNKEYTFKYPDSDDITSNQIAYIQDYMELVEQMIEEGTYQDYIDVESFAKWLLAHDILGSYDSGGCNIYLTKYDQTDSAKVKMATLWDFDSSMRTKDAWSRIHDDPFFYYPNLFNDQSTYFTYRYKQSWAEKRHFVFTRMEAFLKDFMESETANNINASRVYDHIRWNYTRSISVADNINSALDWFEHRKAWLDEAISQLETIINGIESVRSQKAGNGRIYNLSGQQLGHTDGLTPGIYIRNGRKFVVK